MDTEIFLAIYILLLAITIILVAMKKTHWGSIIGVAIIPIYFIWVLIDACRSSGGKIPKKVVEENIRKRLQKADSKSLQDTNTILGVAILYENAMHGKLIMAQKLMEQYKRQGWVPRNLSVHDRTPIAARQLVYGKEIREDAGLDTAGSNAILAKMLAELVTVPDVDTISAIAFVSQGAPLGQIFLAILAK